MERTIADLAVIYINAGKRGLLAELSPAVVERLLSPIPVDAAI
jgi:prolyl-tRNA editing enzyme YbaK/EbsC (Cys-tRNA(Pro) deacylase)